VTGVVGEHAPRVPPVHGLYDRPVGRYDRLAPLDSSFLHIEDLEAPMHTGALAILEGGPFFDGHGRFRLAAVREQVASRAAPIPRFGADSSTWRRQAADLDDDPHFESATNVRLTPRCRRRQPRALLTL